MGYFASPMQGSSVVKSPQGRDGAAGSKSLSNKLDAVPTGESQDRFRGVPRANLVRSKKIPNKIRRSGSSRWQDHRVSAA
jgi:hypothetical protein